MFILFMHQSIARNVYNTEGSRPPKTIILSGNVRYGGVWGGGDWKTLVR